MNFRDGKPFKDWPPVVFFLLSACLFSASFFYPKFLSDDGNSFLKDFLDNDILSVLGFITALANASVLSIFLHLNYLDDEVNFKGTRVRNGLKLSAVSLIVVFLIAFVVVIIKPMFAGLEVLNAILNSIGILCVFFSLSVLRDIMLTVVKIPTKKKIKAAQEENRNRLAETK